MPSDALFTVPNPNPNLQPAAPPEMKKKRNLPGTPDPEAEVIALSPKSLMATNRFLCEICNKGFQREQNLQLHRRGHNLPWKLRQRAPGSEIKKRVYVCPEAGCVHHEPARALGDLTGIKKHFGRKHGEKKWKCERCSKKYAVRSDWKAHSKTCGTREYKCDCGVVFSRKDSFITHRAFCDALTQESAKLSMVMNYPSENKPDLISISYPPPDFISPDSSIGLHADNMNPIMPNNAAFPNNSEEQRGDVLMSNVTTTSAHLSATALLQKAAQMGASMSSPSSSLFGGLTMGSAAAKWMKKREIEMFAGHEHVGSSNTRDFLGLGGDGSSKGQQKQHFQDLDAKFGFMGGTGLDLV